MGFEKHPLRPTQSDVLEHLTSEDARSDTRAANGSASRTTALHTDGDLPHELNVDRFDGVDRAKLQGSELRRYRDIYANDAG